jgi:hypothetical protein
MTEFTKTQNNKVKQEIKKDPNLGITKEPFHRVKPIPPRNLKKSLHGKEQHTCSWKHDHQTTLSLSNQRLLLRILVWALVKMMRIENNCSCTQKAQISSSSKRLLVKILIQQIDPLHLGGQGII